ncbi:arylesterase [uncultured Deefgea sp.]|uniref:arylesterase n=1 Tax=uncultured Deefgea sp. TaxID=1304914 RepID=UPI0025958712|nr:arylesterase [uncultured Deefgea sp.]
MNLVIRLKWLISAACAKRAKYLTKSCKAKPYRWLLAVLLIASQGVFAAKTPTILVYGDSLSAGYGLKAEQAWPRLLETELQRRGKSFQIINASVSGETTAGGLTRFAAIQNKYPAQLLILALGANDGLRGLPTQAMQDNLAKIIRSAQSKGTTVHLVGIQIPPNFGPQYTRAFTASYQKLAKEFQLSFTPFLLAPIVQNNALFQADQLHPTAPAQKLIMQGVLQDLLKQQAALFK